MKCDSVRDLISDYLEGSIDYALWDSFQSHIEKCASCRAEIETIKGTWDVLDSLPEVEVPFSFRHDVVMRAARIQHDRSKKTFQFPDFAAMFRRLPRAVGMVAVATAVALTLVKVTIPINHFSAGMGGQGGFDYAQGSDVSDQSAFDENSVVGQKQLWQSRHLGRNSVWIGVTPNDSGNGRMVYRVLLSLNPSSVSRGISFGRVWAKVNLLPPDSYEVAADGKGLVWEGSILSNGPVLVPVIMDKYQGRHEGVNLLVTWRFRSREFSQIVYIPAHLGGDPSHEVYDLNGGLSDRKSEPGLYSSLQSISEEYGTIVIAPTRVENGAPIVFVHGPSADDALRATLKPWKLDWLACDHAIYVDREYPR